MVSVKLQLKDKHTKASLIVMIVHFGYYELDPSGKKKYKFLRLSTGEKVPVKYWDPGNQKIRQTKAYPEHREQNIRLENQKFIIRDTYRQMTNAGKKITPETFKSEYRKVLSKLENNTLQTEANNLARFIEDYIAKVRSERKKSTMQVYDATLNHLKNYATQKGINMNFESMTLDFYYDFLAYLAEQGISKNTTGKYIKTIKSFLRAAEEDSSIDAHIPQDYKSRRFKVHSEETDSIYLNERDLAKLRNLDLSDKSRLDKVRDQFLVGCYTALRFSDYSRIKKENIQENRHGRLLVIRTAKTNEKIAIPLHAEVIRILDKYNNQLPENISNQKFNVYIKDVCELAKINDECEIKTDLDGKTVHVKRKKYELVTSHTARRTGATNMYLNGVDLLLIMQITGHRRTETLLRYLKTTPEERAQKSAQNAFFQEKADLQIA